MAERNVADHGAPVVIALVSCHGCGVMELAHSTVDVSKGYVAGQLLVLAGALTILVLMIAASL